MTAPAGVPTGPIRLSGPVGRFELTLPENPTTGYLWQFAAAPPAAVRIVGSRFVDDAPGTVGGPGTRVVTLDASEPGRYELAAVLQRPWERTPIAGVPIILTVA